MRRLDKRNERIRHRTVDEKTDQYQILRNMPKGLRRQLLQETHARPQRSEAVRLRRLRQVIQQPVQPAPPQTHPQRPELHVRHLQPIHHVPFQLQETPTDARQNQAVRVRRVRQGLRAGVVPEDTRADALGKELRMRRLLEDVHVPQQPERAQAYARGRENARVRGVQQGVSQAVRPPAAHGDAREETEESDRERLIQEGSVMLL